MDYVIYYCIFLYMNSFLKGNTAMNKITFRHLASSVYIVWLIGFVAGLAIAFSSQVGNARLDTGIIFLPPSFAGIVLSAWLPVILGLLLCRFGNRFAISVLLAVNGLVYGFSSSFLSLMTGSPLGRGFYLISQSCSCLCLLYICGSYQKMNDDSLKKLSCILMFSMGVICFLHYLIL